MPERLTTDTETLYTSPESQILESDHVSLEQGPSEESLTEEKEKRYRELIEESYRRAMLHFEGLINERKKKEQEQEKEPNILKEKAIEKKALDATKDNKSGDSAWPSQISSMEMESKRINESGIFTKVGILFKTQSNKMKGISKAKDTTILQNFLENHVPTGNSNDDGKRDIYHPSSRVLSNLPKLLGKANDPVTTIGKLGSLGVEIDSYTFELDNFEHLQWFVETKGALDILDKVSSAGFAISPEIGPSRYGGSIKPYSALNSARYFLDDPAACAVLDERGKSFKDFLSKTGIYMPAVPEAVEVMARAVGRADVESFCTKYSHKVQRFSSVEPISFLDKVIKLSEKGLLGDIEALEPLVKVEDLLSSVFYGYDKGEVQDTVEKLQTITKDSENRFYLGKVVDILGSKFNAGILLHHLDKIKEIESNWKTAFAGFSTKEGLSKDALHLDEYSIFDIMRRNVEKAKGSRQSIDVLVNPYMKEYSETIGKLSPFNFLEDWKKIGEFFDDKNARKLLMTPEGARLIKLFPGERFLNMYSQYAELLKVDGIFDIIEKTKKIFGKNTSYDASVYHALNAEGILNKVEQLDNIKKILGGLPLSDYQSVRLYGAIFNRNGMSDFIKRLADSEDRGIYKDWSLLEIYSLPDEVIVSPVEKVMGRIGMYNFKNRRFDFVNSPKLRESFFDEARLNPEYRGLFENEGEKQVALVKIDNIRASFLVNENPKELSPLINEILQQFESKYGHKGKTLIALGIAAYGIRDDQKFIEQMESISRVLDMYGKRNLPEGCRVTLGLEYEVVEGMANEYAKTSSFGYKGDIELVSRAAGVGAGRDAVHEIATTPTDNPYILIAEIKLLQDAGFLDFNFEKYPQAARGFHLNLGGESGLHVSKDTFFLNNVITMAGLAGINAGNEVHSTRGVHSNYLSEYFASTVGERIEMKGMGGDSFEQFERTVFTSYHAGIAMQLVDAHLLGSDKGSDFDFLVGLPRNENDFDEYLQENNLIPAPFDSSKDRSILFAWFKLKRDTLMAVREHNESFADSEFSGYVITPDGNYVDTTEHIDIARNQKLLGKIEPGSDVFHVRFDVPEEMLFADTSASLINPLIRVNNVFLKGPADKFGKKISKPSSVNAASMLSVMKEEGYKLTDENETAKQSIFDRGGRIRDGYYYVQGASEEMITHKVQIILNNFNRKMRELLIEQNISPVENSKGKVQQKQTNAI